MTYLSRLRLWQKFVIVVALLAVPSLVQLGLYEHTASQTRDRKLLEVTGVEHASPLSQLLGQLAVHRDLALVVLDGSSDKSDALRVQARVVDEHFARVEQYEEANRERFDLSAHGGSLRAGWERLKSRGGELSGADSFTRHTELILNGFGYLRRLGVVSGLRAETDPAMAGLQSALTETLPRAAEVLARIRGIATAVAIKTAMSEVQKNALFSDLGELRRVEKALLDELGEVIEHHNSLGTVLGPRIEAWKSARTELTERVRKDILDVWPVAVDAGVITTLGNAAVAQTEGLREIVQPAAVKVLNERVSSTTERMIITLLAVVSAIVLALVVAYFVTAGVSRRAATAMDLLGRIEDGHLDNVIPTEVGDETSEILLALGSMQEQLRARIEAEREIASEMQRIKQAMDSSTSCVMLTDSSDDIVYVNPAMAHMLEALTDDMRTTLGTFDPKAVVGSNLSAFELPNTLDDEGRRELRLEYGSRSLVLFIHPVLDGQGVTVGRSLEWRDRTEELAAEEEVARIVAAAQRGDLSGRILTDDKAGFYQVIGEGVNELFDLCEHVVSDIGRVMSAIARGDLTARIEHPYHGSFGRLKEDVNTSSQKLVEVLGEIKAGAGLVASGASQLARGNDDLAQRTERQRSSLDETASSMDEITTTVRQNADNAQEADQLACATRDQAEQGGEVMQDVVQSMEEIHSASGRIVDIIGVIDEIAFQTNLLALNAAVEAARAGEQGRGFAVVASEVRNLAGRSASAAKEIKELIQDSVAKVQDGSALVSKSRDVFVEIASSVDKVTHVVAEIASASREQSLGIDQINHAIAQMERMTHENATLVQEGAKASSSMGEQAGQLNHLVDFFQIGVDVGPREHSISAGSVLNRSNPNADQASPNVASPNSYRGVERRGSARPWSGAEQGAHDAGGEEATEGVSALADACSSDGEDWDEF